MFLSTQNQSDLRSPQFRILLLPSWNSAFNLLWAHLLLLFLLISAFTQSHGDLTAPSDRCLRPCTRARARKESSFERSTSDLLGSNYSPLVLGLFRPLMSESRESIHEVAGCRWFVPLSSGEHEVQLWCCSDLNSRVLPSILVCQSRFSHLQSLLRPRHEV